MRGASHHPVIVLLLTVVLVAGCGFPGPSPSPAASTAPLPAPTSSSGVPGSTASPALMPTLKPKPSDPFLGQVVTTVSDNLRVRSEPRVADDSIKYELLLPLGTELQVLDGPAMGSGYTWYKVAPVSFAMSDGAGSGWVAMAGKDGEPWIALADAPIAGIELAKADVARATADPAEAKKAAASINAFGLDLYKRMLADGTLKPGENAVFSPTSIALALAMARAGAKGETAAQMDAVLHTSGWDELGPGLDALEQALTSRNATWQSESFDPPTRELALRIANAAFAQRDWAIEQAYLERIGSTFGAGVRLVDYRADPEAACKLINAWVSDQTKKRIPALLPRDILARSTRLGLVNAIYLKATWETEFFNDGDGAPAVHPPRRLPGQGPDDAQLADRGSGSLCSRHRLAGDRAALPRRRRHGPARDDPHPARRSRGLRAEAHGEPALRGIVGKLERRRTTTSSMTRSRFARGPNRDACVPPPPTTVRSSMPRFGIETKRDLVLRFCCVPWACPSTGTPPPADFSGITAPSGSSSSWPLTRRTSMSTRRAPRQRPRLRSAWIRLVAAAASRTLSKVITLRLNHPFLFVLRDLETGAVLFMGRVADPSVGR